MNNFCFFYQMNSFLFIFIYWKCVFCVAFRLCTPFKLSKNKIKPCKFKLNTNHAQDLFDCSDEPNEQTPVRILFANKYCIEHLYFCVFFFGEEKKLAIWDFLAHIHTHMHMYAIMRRKGVKISRWEWALHEFMHSFCMFCMCSNVVILLSCAMCMVLL